MEFKARGLYKCKDKSEGQFIHDILVNRCNINLEPIYESSRTFIASKYRGSTNRAGFKHEPDDTDSVYPSFESWCRIVFYPDDALKVLGYYNLIFPNEYTSTNLTEKKENNNGNTIVQTITTTIVSGQRVPGNIVSGRPGSAQLTTGRCSYEAISC